MMWKDKCGIEATQQSDTQHNIRQTYQILLGKPNAMFYVVKYVVVVLDFILLI